MAFQSEPNFPCCTDLSSREGDVFLRRMKRPVGERSCSQLAACRASAMKRNQNHSAVEGKERRWEEENLQGQAILWPDHSDRSPEVRPVLPGWCRKVSKLLGPGEEERQVQGKGSRPGDDFRFLGNWTTVARSPLQESIVSARIIDVYQLKRWIAFVCLRRQIGGKREKICQFKALRNEIFRLSRIDCNYGVVAENVSNSWTICIYSREPGKRHFKNKQLLVVAVKRQIIMKYRRGRF